MSSCAIPARSSPPPPKPTSTPSPARCAPSSARCTCSTRSTSAASRPPSAGPRWTAARTRPPRSAARMRSRSPSPRRASRTAPSGPPKPRDYLRGYFCAAALTGQDLRAVAAWVSGADPDVPEQILAAAGAHQWALTLAELRSEAHKTAATVRMVMSQGPVVHGRPGAGRLGPARPGRRVRHPRVPARRRHRVHDRRSRLRGSPGRAAVRRDGHRDPLRRRAARPGVGGPAAGSAAADGPGRGDPDLPGARCRSGCRTPAARASRSSPWSTAKPSWPDGGGSTAARSCSTPPR